MVKEFFRMTTGLLAASVLLLVGCGKEEPEVRTYQLATPSDVKVEQEQPETAGLPKGHPPVSPSRNATATPAEAPSAKQKSWGWTVPDGWTEKPGGGMRMASFAVTSAPELDASVITLGAAAGGLDANVNRWRRQVGLAAQSEEEIKSGMKSMKTAGGQTAMICDLSENGAEKAIRAGIIQTDEETVFVKLIGPTEDVAAAATAFDALIASMKKL